MKNSKTSLLLGLAVAASLLAGCASNDYEEIVEAQDQSLQGFEEVAANDTSGLYVEEDPALADAEAGGAEQAVAGNIGAIFYFAFDTATLDSQTRAALDAQIGILKDTVGTIRLEGHADERGTREYNIALAERRAVAIANYMALNGIPRYRIETVSYGEERPVAFGQDEESWALNRRVELK